MLSISSCFEKFDEWFKATVERTSPDIIVAIARGAVRLLQLHNVHQMVPDTLICSNHALAFLRDQDIRGLRVLIFDDSAIYGSTMAEVRKQLCARGAIVILAAYVADRSYFGPKPTEESPNAVLDPIVSEYLDEDDVRRHHADLVQRVFHSGLDFNLDFPLISLRVEDFHPKEIPFLAAKLREDSDFAVFHNVTTPSTRFSQIERWTAIHDWVPTPKQSAVFGCQTNGKTRITFIPEKAELRLKPIVQYAIRTGADPKSIEFGHPEIDALWQSIIRVADAERPCRDAALLRLLSFFGATIFGSVILKKVEQVITNECRVHSSEFDEQDAVFVLGPRLGSELKTAWAVLRNLPVDEVINAVRRPFVKPECSGMKLRDPIKNYIRNHIEFRPTPNSHSIESIGKLLLAIKEVTDSKSVRRERPNYSRLNAGMSFDGISSLLSDDYGVNLDRNDLSLALDYCVDRALAVPKVIEDQGWWLREFYSGEGGDSQDIPQVKARLFDVVKNLEATGKKPVLVTPFEVQKICATLHDLYPFFPVEVAPNNFGMTCTLGGKDLVACLTEGDNPPFVFVNRGGVDFDTKKQLKINPQFKAEVKSTWDYDQTWRFQEGFKNLRALFGSVSTDAMLLISTCGTAAKCFQAIAYELHAWCGTLSRSQLKPFSEVIQNCQADITADGKIQGNVVPKIFWGLTWIEEAYKKLRIWHQYRLHREEVLSKLAGLPEVELWWNACCGDAKLLTKDEADYEKALASLSVLVEQAATLTEYVVQAAIESGALKLTKLRTEWRHRGRPDDDLSYFEKPRAVTLARTFNERCVRYRSHDGVHFTQSSQLCEQPVPTAASNRDWFKNSFENAQKCFFEISQNLVKLFPKEKTDRGVERFSIGQYRAVTDLGHEHTKDGVFILALNLSGCDEAEARRSIRKELADKMATTESKREVIWDSSPHSVSIIGYCGYADTVTKLIAIAEEIEKKHTHQHAAGLVPVIAFGSVIVGETQDGMKYLRDKVPGFSIQEAQRMSEAVAKRFPQRDPSVDLFVTEAAKQRLLDTKAGVSEVRQETFFADDASQDVLGVGYAMRRGASLVLVGEYDVFLSMNSADRKLVDELKVHLELNGIRPWIDSEGLLPGDNWFDEIEKNLKNFPSIAVCIGPHGFGPIHRVEAQVTQMLEARFGNRLIPVLLPGAQNATNEMSAWMQLKMYSDLRDGWDSTRLKQLAEGIRKAMPSPK